MENVILTPHVAAVTPDSMLRMSMYSSRQLVEVLRGGRPWTPVNPEVLSRRGRL